MTIKKIDEYTVEKTETKSYQFDKMQLEQEKVELKKRITEIDQLLDVFKE